MNTNHVQAGAAMHKACLHLNSALDNFYEPALARMHPAIAQIELDIQHALKALQDAHVSSQQNQASALPAALGEIK